MSYRSCAEWPPHIFTAFDGSHISTDLHESESQPTPTDQRAGASPAPMHRVVGQTESQETP